MSIDENGYLLGTAKVFKKDKQWVIAIEGLPEWVMEDIKEFGYSGFDVTKVEGELPNHIVLQGKWYPD